MSTILSTVAQVLYLGKVLVVSHLRSLPELTIILPLWGADRRLLNLGWVKGKEVEAAKPKFYSLCLSCIRLSRVVACVSPSLTFCPSIVVSLTFFLAAIYVELESGLRFQFSALAILICNTSYTLSSQSKHTPDLVILIFVFADLPANSPNGHGSRRFA